jgi:hypothetical protein
MIDETEITSENFKDYFFDIRQNRPKAGQIMAKFTAIAEFVGEGAKKDMIYLMTLDKAHQASMVMRKIHGAKEPDCYRVCREIAEDMLAGKSEQEIIDKPYEFVIELFFYTQREHVPKNDPHWETIQLMKYDDETKTFKSTIEI